jgi:cytochrome c oxidase assembly factor CtaG
MLITLFAVAGLYGRGLRRLRAATRGPGRLRFECGCYFAGWFALVVALVSPLHPWGQVLFSAHMTQHEVLMLVAAPLLVLGRPGLVLLWAMPRPAAKRFGRWTHVRVIHGLWAWLNQPFVAWLLHALALWLWHIPSWFEATLRNEAIHDLQHASFFFSALLFWHAVLQGPRRVLGYGAGVLYLFTTAIHSGALGALITFGRSVWYPHYLETSPTVGMTALDDQQLGGLIMWIPAGFVYVIAALILFRAWLSRSDATHGPVPAMAEHSPSAARLAPTGSNAVGPVLHPTE